MIAVRHRRGLAPDFLPFVFDRFRQADRARRAGTAALVSACRSSSTWSNCTAARSRRERRHRSGATFRVSLPIPVLLESPPDKRGAERPERDAFAMRFNGYRILIVDDDAATRELLTQLFERTGASVETAASARLALSTSPGPRPIC